MCGVPLGRDCGPEGKGLDSFLMLTVKSTTILAIRSETERRGVIASDGQATLDTTVIKSNTKKVYRLYDGRVLTGFAGATSDCLSLLDKFEGKLKKYDGRLRRSAVELTKEWRGDQFLRDLEAVLVTVSEEGILMIFPTVPKKTFPIPPLSWSRGTVL